jgi:hypothetical protein
MSRLIGIRTQEEVVARIKRRKPLDPLGDETTDLICCLDFEHAKPYLKADMTEEKWNPPEVTVEELRETIVSYLPFAFEKCLNHRGLSANRSVGHFRSWCWLIGDEKVEAFIEAGNYAPYGAPILAKVAEGYGVEVPTDESFKNMLETGSCGSEYACGCRS